MTLQIFFDVSLGNECQASSENTVTWEGNQPRSRTVKRSCTNLTEFIAIAKRNVQAWRSLPSETSKINLESTFFCLRVVTVPEEHTAQNWFNYLLFTPRQIVRSNCELYAREVKKLCRIFQNNGYPDWFINNVIKNIEENNNTSSNYEKDFMFTILAYRISENLPTN